MTRKARGKASLPVSLELLTNLDPKVRGEVEINLRGVSTKITHGALADPEAPFQIGETITGAPSGGTGVVIHVGDGFLIYRPVAGGITDAETITGGTSGASATTTTAPAAEPHRFILDIQGGIEQGRITDTHYTITSKAGTAFSTIDAIELQDSDDLTSSLEGTKTLIRDESLVIAGSAPIILVNSNENKRFVTKGTAAKLQILVDTTGGAADSDWKLIIQVFGEESF